MEFSGEGVQLGASEWEGTSRGQGRCREEHSADTQACGQGQRELLRAGGQQGGTGQTEAQEGEGGQAFKNLLRAQSRTLFFTLIAAEGLRRH